MILRKLPVEKSGDGSLIISKVMSGMDRTSLPNKYYCGDGLLKMINEPVPATSCADCFNSRAHVYGLKQFSRASRPSSPKQLSASGLEGREGREFLH